MLLSSLGTSIANVALPTLAKVFDASFQAASWVVLAYLLTVTSSIVSVGRLGDRIGRRRLLLAGLSLFTAASIVAGLAPALWRVIVARAAQGLGAAVMMALSLALVGEVVPKARTGSGMGLLGTASAIGAALGPSLADRPTASGLGLDPGSVPSKAMRDGVNSRTSRRFVPILLRSWRFSRQPLVNGPADKSSPSYTRYHQRLGYPGVRHRLLAIGTTSTSTASGTVLKPHQNFHHCLPPAAARSTGGRTSDGVDS